MPIADPHDPATWPAILAALKETVDPRAFDLWLRTTRLLGTEGETLLVGANGEFQRNWIAQGHVGDIERAAEKVLLRPFHIEVRVAPPGSAPAAPAQEEAPRSAREEAAPEEALGSGRTALPPASRAEPFPERGSLNPHYTFEQFVVGPSNRIPHAACLAAAESPGHAYNPIFLHGGVGLGKTHLLHAVCHSILGRAPRTNVAILSCEAFTNEFIDAIEHKRIQEFRSRFRHVDVLAIDDIHFLGGKAGTQEEFFHTFNALYTTHRQIILSCDSLPKEIQGIEERLISRFQWGLVAELEPPHYETRVAILKKKARLLQVELPDDVTHFLAEHCQKNIRELEGAITTLIGYSRLDGRSLDLTLAEEAFRSTRTAPVERPVSVAVIQQIVAQHFGLRSADLTSKRRSRSVTYPRQIAIFLAHQMIAVSLEEIGSYFGGRHHTTVMYAIEQITTRREQDAALQALLDDLAGKVRKESSAR